MENLVIGITTPQKELAKAIFDTRNYTSIFQAKRRFLIRNDVMATMGSKSIASVQVYSSLRLLNTIESALEYTFGRKSKRTQAEYILLLGSACNGLLLQPSFVSVAMADVRVKMRHYTAADISNWVSFVKFLYEKPLEIETLATLEYMKDFAASALMYHIWLNRK